MGMPTFPWNEVSKFHLIIIGKGRERHKLKIVFTKKSDLDISVLCALQLRVVVHLLRTQKSAKSFFQEITIRPSVFLFQGSHDLPTSAV